MHALTAWAMSGEPTVCSGWGGLLQDTLGLLEGYNREQFTTLLTNWYRATKGKFKARPPLPCAQMTSMHRHSSCGTDRCAAPRGACRVPRCRRCGSTMQQQRHAPRTQDLGDVSLSRLR